jgi:hypothetical protein
MAVRTLCLSALFFLAPILSSAQECKIKFAVVYNDGEKLQIGRTPEQKKMWDHDGPKKFKGLCADDKDPNYIILWSEGLTGAELTKVGLDHFNNLRSTGEMPGGNSNVKKLQLDEHHNSSETVWSSPRPNRLRRPGNLQVPLRRCSPRPGLSGCSAGRH